MTIELKIAGVGLSIALLAGLSVAVPEHFKNKWQNQIRSEYAESARVATTFRLAEIERIKKDHEHSNKIIIDNYESRLSILNDKYLAARAIGLRMPKNSCSGLTTPAETTSSSRSDDGESVRLPRPIEEGLFNLARQADEVNIQLRACQSWIKTNGFYDAKP